MSEFSNTVVSLFGRAAAPEQGGLINGQDPTKFNTADPLRLWIVQWGLIIVTSQLLGLGLRRIRQPKVIAEVIGGIILGPTAFGRIPGFTNHIFPSQSLPYLSLTANIGLVLFLFIVGMEVETARIRKNLRFSLTIGLGGIILPFSLGCAIAVPIYNRFIDHSIKFTRFMLFTGVSYSITAFPVLCRILTELKLLDTKVGVVVLSAGVGNDILGWTLLALTVALVNSTNGANCVYILLCTIAWTLVLLFPMKRAMLWLAHKTGSVENGPSLVFMTVTMVLTFASAFFTDIVGVHAIFGGFIVGLIVPRSGGLNILLTEKLEDMVQVLFLPLYFTLSGLSTDLGLLNTGIAWAFMFAIASLDFSGKFTGCTTMARFNKLPWRESATIGTLMSCKGLVELIVLNVGLSAGILTKRVFAMFVLDALILTFLTTPVVSFLYPPKYRVRLPGSTDALAIKRDEEKGDDEVVDGFWKSRLTVVLDKLEHLSGVVTLTQLLHAPPPYSEKDLRSEVGSISSDTKKSTSAAAASNNTITVNAIRLIELSDRTSAVMRSSTADALLATDPVLGLFRTFGEISGIPVHSTLAMVNYDDLASRVIDHARDNRSQLILVPWLPPIIAQVTHSGDEPSSHTTFNPYETLFRASPPDSTSSAVHSQFIRSVFSQSHTDVALFVDRPKPPHAALGHSTRQHLYLPFFGGPDDRLALEFVIQLCSNPRITATVVRISKSDLETQETPLEKPSPAFHQDHTISAHPDTIYGQHTTQTRMQSETVDNILWARYSSAQSGAPHPTYVQGALSRINFREEAATAPLHHVSAQAVTLLSEATKAEKRLVIVAGRSRRMAVAQHTFELRQLIERNGNVAGEMKRTIGDVASALVVTGCQTPIVVMQASMGGAIAE